ncbi:MAG: hypothetical protein IH942_00425 [Acidobacteria bacterium]|nr:hypothetical protein [Acidobacteriota bacterium]
MRRDLNLEVLVGLAVDARADLLFCEGTVLAALDEIDALHRAVMHAEELLDDVDVEVNLVPSATSSRDASNKKAVGSADGQLDICCERGFGGCTTLRLDVATSSPATHDVFCSAFERRFVDRSDIRGVIDEEAVPRRIVEDLVGRSAHDAEGLEVLAKTARR